MKKPTREEVAAKWLGWSSGYYTPQQFSKNQSAKLAIYMLREIYAAKPSRKGEK